MGYPITADNPARNNPFRFYVADNIRQKRFRRTKAAVAGIRTAIIDILSKDNPQTVRQVFYALTVRGVITKAEIEYQRTVVRLLGEMREAGTISFEWIADNTRWQRKPRTFTGIEACLNSTASFYRRDLHDLVGALKGRIVYRDKIIEKTKVIYPKVEELSTREIAQLCLDQDTSHLNDRERQFLEDMSRRYGVPTPKQEAVCDPRQAARAQKEILSFAPAAAAPSDELADDEIPF